MGGKVSFPVITLPKERTVIVTGATAGIGYETAKWIAMMGASVIIACRSEEKSMEAITRMNKEYKELKEQGTEGLADVEELGVEYMNPELSSFKSTKEFVEAFKKSGRQLHVLICNAGIMARNYVKTDDGFESSLQVNYLSHFLMIGQLLPVMMKSDSGDVRIVLVSADLHRIPRLYDTNQINYSGDPNKYSMLTSYSRSKLYQIMQMYCLQRRLRNTNISVTSLHPGVIQTELTRDYNEVWWFRTMKSIGRVKELVSKPTTALEGATTTIYAAISPEMKGVSGIYLKDCKEGGVSATARDERKQEELWTKTMEFLKEQLTEEEILVLEGKHGDTSKG